MNLGNRSLCAFCFLQKRAKRAEGKHDFATNPLERSRWHGACTKRPGIR